MPQLKNFVAVDWRSGKDAIHFFFKDTETFSRFNIGSNNVPAGYPRAVSGRWDTFRQTKDLLFGFTTTCLDGLLHSDSDISWLFYKDGSTPKVCKYDQDNDNVIGTYLVADTLWRPILPYFDKIICGTLQNKKDFDMPHAIKFLLNDGHFLDFDLTLYFLSLSKITSDTTNGLELYTSRIITAAQNDRTFGSPLWYIFLTNNQYVVFDLSCNRLTQHARNVDDGTWPGLLRG